ncbi:hypothetical protein DQP57_00470 [Mycobacterium colombiense]|uniref:Alpha/beta hydrolase fold-3 domain-containing protein n=1 Tax=Mycobacterium colombiense TaxID=339268 RepID=A0A329MFU0_9MYCO|nr:alpha/beta hydrolase [Mycobacterium colombiense]RAV17533.1 hypothetical protein DQP57_00470 [Mycobacterium colombiense]
MILPKCDVPVGDLTSANPLMIYEAGPSAAARLLTKTTRLCLRNTLTAGCRAAALPWPYGAIEKAASLVPSVARRAAVRLPHVTAQLICAPGVVDQGERVILYCHGGAFLVCGPNTHGDLITRLSRVSNGPILAPDYRMLPKHSIGDAVADCMDAYHHLRETYEPHQITLAGDSAGGYLALTVADLIATFLCETPAALVMFSPLLELDPAGKKAHPNIACDAMFGSEAFDALHFLIRRSTKGGVLHEPLESLSPYLPPVLIHVSGQEALLHDTFLASSRLADVGVPVEVHVWPGQIHVFQIAASFVPEARRSLSQVGRFIKAKTTESRKCHEHNLTLRTGTVGY